MIGFARFVVAIKPSSRKFKQINIRFFLFSFYLTIRLITNSYDFFYGSIISFTFVLFSAKNRISIIPTTANITIKIKLP